MEIENENQLNNNDIHKIVDRYKKRFEQNGYSPLSLGWGKGRQNLRFKMLTSNFELNGKSILDIGCGFGDLNKWFEQNRITNYTYHGIDVVEDFIYEAINKYSNKAISFQKIEFLNQHFESSYDYIVESGIFNFQMDSIDNYDYIYRVMSKAFRLCNIAISFDFLSNKVDFQRDGAFHSEPCKILEMAYHFSSRVILNNSYMPYEFNITIFKETEISYDKMCYMPYNDIE